ncbi:restriction endonuclease [Desulfoscipio gibsoniae]|uniref:Restriction endonuclease n=1 Tax=Desulfoscipio gibsoniae DSM 7213 TaxID=767817 RepID=R4KED4_9FIRM|nr:restriction endonuclease [Desulfoscipio gibsoniae]AGL01528.1 Restriction endonuclease [Desulfoscipio gibsoniae DSM 7213]
MFNKRIYHYMQNPPRDERNRLAHTIDFAITLLFTWFITILAAQFLPLGQSMINIIIIPIMIAEIILVTKIKISRRKALSIHRDIWYSARKCRQNIENIHDREEFAQLVKELLEGIAPFEGMKKLNPCPDSTIDLSGYLRNQKIGVMCINTAAKDNRVTADQIKGFLQEIKQAQFNIGIIITSGSYTDEARRFVRRMSGRIKIHLVESNGLLHMAKRTEHPIFPVEKWQEEGYTRISGLEMALSIKENIMASKKRALLFTLLGIAFLVIGALQTGLISTIYVIFGVINLFIGLTGFILSLLHKNELIFD